MNAEADDIRGQRKLAFGWGKLCDRRKIIQCKGNNTTQARADEWKGSENGNGNGIGIANGIGTGSGSGSGIQGTQDFGFGARYSGAWNRKGKGQTCHEQRTKVSPLRCCQQEKLQSAKKKKYIYIYRRKKEQGGKAKAANYTFSVYFVFIESSGWSWSESENEISKK